MNGHDESRYLGCILGGAAGDALGYPVEFWGEGEIDRQFAGGGIRALAEAAALEHAREGDSYAVFSDDTQMTLYTAAGLLAGAARGTRHVWDGERMNVMGIWHAYEDWLLTQHRSWRHAGTQRNRPTLWLNDIDALNVRRAPGNTCLSAISDGTPGTLDEPLNNSCGCGGIMRVAPIPLFCASVVDDARDAAQLASDLAARAAALTHGHVMGWLPAAALSRIISRLLELDAPADAKARRRDLATSAVEGTREAEADLKVTSTELSEGVRLATELALERAESGLTHPTELADIHRLGEGWVGHEALYIAVYAACAHPDDFAEALRCAVSHRGDSDSTGAVAGNILGSYLGIQELRAACDLDHLEQVDLLTEIALELCHANDPSTVVSGTRPWAERYR